MDNYETCPRCGFPEDKTTILLYGHCRGCENQEQARKEYLGEESRRPWPRPEWLNEDYGCSFRPFHVGGVVKNPGMVPWNFLPSGDSIHYPPKTPWVVAKRDRFLKPTMDASVKLLLKSLTDSMERLLKRREKAYGRK